MMKKLFLVLLLIIIIFVCSLMSYKIETFDLFVNNDNVPTPNNETCYNYIKNIKNWDVSTLTSNQQKVIFTMRALLGSQFTDNTKVFPFKDGCVIPSSHLPIYDLPENATSMTVTPENSSPITITQTDTTMYPLGLYVDFTDPTMTFEKFKDFLDGAYLLYDSDFFKQQQSLQTEITRLTSVRDVLKQTLANLVTQTNTVNNNIAALEDPNSDCQQTKNNNLNVLIPQWNNLIEKSDYYLDRYNTLVGYINDGIKQSNSLNQTYMNVGSGIFVVDNGGGNVNNLAQLPKA